MLYLLRSFGRGNKSILKVGFSDSPKKRFYQYFSGNPLYEPISIRGGDMIFESILHFYLRSLGYQFKRNGCLDEWYVDSPEILQIFHISRKKLEWKVWKFRNKYFKGSKFDPKSEDYKIFKYLYLKYHDNSFCGEEFIIEEGQLIKTAAKRVDIDFWEVYSRTIENLVSQCPSEFQEVNDFLDNHFYKTGIFREKMKMYCEFCDTYKDNLEIMNALGYKIQDPKYRMYYDFYGTKGCRAVSYQESDLYRGWKDMTKEDELLKTIYQRFKVSERYSLSELKEILAGIYSSLGISRTAKASDLGKYFKLKKTKITLPDKSIVNGFKLEKLD